MNERKHGGAMLSCCHANSAAQSFCISGAISHCVGDQVPTENTQGVCEDSIDQKSSQSTEEVSNLVFPPHQYRSGPCAPDH